MKQTQRTKEKEYAGSLPSDGVVYQPCTHLHQLRAGLADGLQGRALHDYLGLQAAQGSYKFAMTALNRVQLCTAW